jgi:hypothetical protein
MEEAKAVGNNSRIKSFPDLLRKEALAALLMLTLVCLVAALVDAPLDGPADPQGVPPENVKAPWIFVGIQQLLRYLPPVYAGIILPTAAFLAVSLVAFVPQNRQRLSRWTFVITSLFFAALTVWGYLR